MSPSKYARLLTPGLLVAGCSQGVSDPGVLDDSTESIVGGTTASAYPESALIDISKNGTTLAGYCSGSVIAPRVVLTAGHCVIGFKAWKVTVPFADKQTETSTEGLTYDWTSTAETVNPKQHDVGLVFLSKGVTLPSMPVLAQASIADGTKVVNIGRIDDGKLSKSALYVSSPIAVKSASKMGYPYDYYSSDVIESGDSGGPVVVSGSSPHQIVAVNSGGGTSSQVLARVDLVYSWIDQQVVAHGGWGSSGSDAGGDSNNGSGTGVPQGSARDAGTSESCDGADCKATTPRPGHDAGVFAGAGGAGPGGKTEADGGAVTSKGSGGGKSTDAGAAGARSTSAAGATGGTPTTGAGDDNLPTGTDHNAASSGETSDGGGGNAGLAPKISDRGEAGRAGGQSPSGGAGATESGNAGWSGVTEEPNGDRHPGCTCRVPGESSPAHKNGMAALGISLGALLARRRRSRP